MVTVFSATPSLEELAFTLLAEITVYMPGSLTVRIWASYILLSTWFLQFISKIEFMILALNLFLQPWHPFLLSSMTNPSQSPAVLFPQLAVYFGHFSPFSTESPSLRHHNWVSSLASLHCGQPSLLKPFKYFHCHSTWYGHLQLTWVGTHSLLQFHSPCATVSPICPLATLVFLQVLKTTMLPPWQGPLHMPHPLSFPLLSYSFQLSSKHQFQRLSDLLG